MLKILGNAICWRIDAFELWCWRRLLRVPWTARISNQYILKETSPECSLEEWFWSWRSNTLATWCKELSHWKRLWCWERLKEGGEGDDRGRDGWMASPTQWTQVWASSRSWWWIGSHAVHGVAKSRNDRTTKLNWWYLHVCTHMISHRYRWYRFIHGYFGGIFCVSVNLLTVILYTRNAWGIHLGHYCTWWAPTGIF